MYRRNFAKMPLPEFDNFYTALRSGLLDRYINLDFKEMAIERPDDPSVLEMLLDPALYERFEREGKLPE